MTYTKDQLESIRIKYQVSLNLFSSEGQIQWNRFNAMLVGNAFVIAFYNGTLNNLPKYFIHLIKYVPIAGIFICLLWFNMTIRGFKWINFWIKEANTLEKDLDGNINPIQSGKLEKNNFLTTQHASYIIIAIFMLFYNALYFANPPYLYISYFQLFFLESIIISIEFLLAYNYSIYFSVKDKAYDSLVH